MDLFADQIPLLKPWIDEDETNAVVEVLRSGWITLGPRVEEFEKQVTRLVGAPHAIAVNSATSGLHLAFQVAGLRPGDKVIVPAHTCMATVNGIVLAGGIPVFADIDHRTFNLDIGAVEEAMDDSVRAIALVHQIGLPADLDAFGEFARKHQLLLIEDAATAFGAKYRSRYLGAHGNPTVFSFHPRKMITTGEGGMLILSDADQAQRARRLRSAGASISDLVRHQAKGVLQQVYPEPGFNYRLTDLQAAVGLAQLRKLPQMLEARAQQADYYSQQLRAVDEIQTPFVPSNCCHCFTSYCVTIAKGTHEIISWILDDLAAEGISCRRGIQPLYREPHFRESHRGMYLPNTEAAAAKTIFLPIFPGLTRPQQDRVVHCLIRSVRKHLPKAKCA
jgi:dTDP-4-amino-4,6-dideoxygalactose transaminase